MSENSSNLLFSIYFYSRLNIWVTKNFKESIFVRLPYVLFRKNESYARNFNYSELQISISKSSKSP